MKNAVGREIPEFLLENGKEVYQGKNYRDDSALVYFDNSREKELMHPQTNKELRYILVMLAEKGEKETFRYLKNHVLKNKPFPWEE